ncbi:hypothetical protein [Helicobacter trogontum]|nr:hypothetical protein [Helicobacter trogontum]MCI5785965.1 hypothetical protein [Helicobacter trogontum]MDY5185322.1 hypothetical protein [Helicobacter trogontum]TLD98939.1 hypothetical protein LS80_002775 [Helicobacter trogontum]
MKYDRVKIEQWIKSFKIALIENNIQEAFTLTQNLPFNTAISMESADKEMIEYLDIAKELISQTIELLESSRHDTRQQMEKIRQAKKFFS